MCTCVNEEKNWIKNYGYWEGEGVGMVGENWKIFYINCM